MRKFLTAAFLLAGLSAPAFAVSGTVTLVNNPALAYSTVATQNLLQFASPQGAASKLSVQVTYASATIPAQTFIGGQESTATITVVSTQALIASFATDSLTMPTTAQILGSPATGQITVESLTGLAGVPASFTTALSSYAYISSSSPSIVLNGYLTYTWGGNWASTDTIQHAATTLASAINAGGTFTASVVSSTGVAITYISSGTSYNGYPVTSSNGNYVSTGVYSGGTNPTTVTINNTLQNFAFTYGANWPSTDTVTDAAGILAGLINDIGGNGPALGIGSIVASNVSGEIFATATVNGSFQNAYTMATTSSPLVSVSSTNFSGGLNRALLGAYFKVGAYTYRNGYHWSDASNTSTGAAQSITNFLNSISTTINSDDTGGFGNVTASTSGGVVNLKAGAAGAAGNLITLATTQGPGLSGFTAGSALFTGGQDNASFTINGTVFQYPTNWTLGSSSTTSTAAGSIAAAIDANAVLGPLIAASNTSNVVYATATNNGTVYNYTLTSSTQSQLTAVGFTGGLNPAYSSGSATISLPNHGFTTALPVLFSTPSGGSIAGLVGGTTYYVIVADANDIELATTSALAQSNFPVILKSTDPTTSAHTYTVTPSTYIAGSASASWQASNDGVNWTAYSTTAGGQTVNSNTFTAINPSTTTVQDFGVVDYNYLRYNITGPNQGGVNLKVILTAKD
jgi:hypothetical protein